MKWWRYGLGALLGMSLLTSCDGGGQTGQPTSAHDCRRPVALDVTLDGVSGQQLLDTFIGKYSATLHWQADAGAPADEEVTFEVAAATVGVAKEGSSYPCGRLLAVPVAASLTFADGSVLSSGDATLSATYGTFDASLVFLSGQKIVSVQMRRPASGVTVQGKLEPDGVDGPSGVFSSDDGAAGSSGQ